MVMSPKYKEFYDEYKNKLFSYLMFKSGDYEVSQDVMQESFTRHFQNYGNDAVISPALLFTIARNALVDHLRNQKRFVATHYVPSSTAADGEQSHIVKEKSDTVLRAMAKLSQLDREILTLAVRGVPYKEIAISCNRSEASVKVRIHRARVKLCEILVNEDI